MKREYCHITKDKRTPAKGSVHCCFVTTEESQPVGSHAAKRKAWAHSLAEALSCLAALTGSKGRCVFGQCTGHGGFAVIHTKLITHASCRSVPVGLVRSCAGRTRHFTLVLLMTHLGLAFFRSAASPPSQLAGTVRLWADRCRERSCRQQKTSFGCVSAASRRCLANHLRQPTDLNA
jgi:hypothetical protein